MCCFNKVNLSEILLVHERIIKGLCSPEDGHNDARNMMGQVVNNKHLIVGLLSS